MEYKFYIRPHMTNYTSACIYICMHIMPICRLYRCLVYLFCCTVLHPVSTRTWCVDFAWYSRAYKIDVDNILLVKITKKKTLLVLVECLVKCTLARLWLWLACVHVNGGLNSSEGLCERVHFCVAFVCNYCNSGGQSFYAPLRANKIQINMPQSDASINPACVCSIKILDLRIFILKLCASLRKPSYTRNRNQPNCKVEFVYACVWLCAFHTYLNYSYYNILS